MDRLTALPEDLRLQILSYLNTREAIRTSVLSRSWRYQWTRLSCFDFTISNEGNYTIERRRLVVRMLDQTVTQLKVHASSCSKLQKLLVSILVNHHVLASRVSKLLAYAVDCNVEELCFENKYTSFYDYFLPNTVLASKFLTTLDLRGCCVKATPASRISLPFLKKLVLSKVKLGDGTLDCITANTPLIEKIILESIRVIDGAKIAVLFAGLPNLKEVKIERVPFKTITVKALNLETFQYCSDDYQFGIENYCKINVASCSNIKKLHLQGAGVTDSLLNSLLPLLPILEDLTLRHCNFVKQFRVSSVHMKNLQLEDCQELVDAQIQTPNLQIFSYHGKSVLSLTSGGLALVKATIFVDRFEDESSYIKYIALLAAVNHCLELNLPCGSAWIPEDVKKISCPPLYDVRKVSVKRYHDGAVNTVGLLQNLLWLCPRPETIQVIEKDLTTITVEFVYEKIDISQESCSCCMNIPVKCWRQSLKEVKFHNLPDAKVKELQKFVQDSTSRRQR